MRYAEEYCVNCMDWNETLIVAMLIALAESEMTLGKPTSSMDLRHLVQNVQKWQRVSLLQYMYRITLQNMLWNLDKYSFRHPHYCSYTKCNCQWNINCKFDCLWTLRLRFLKIAAGRIENYNVRMLRSEAVYRAKQICK